ncbi:MAG: hypothetical protein ACLFRP_02970 [Puniceicoccaceae bacterium]
MLERKGRVVFIILLAVVVVSFVFVIGETPGCVGGEPGAGSVREYYGYNLDSESDTRGLVQEVVISSLVNRGQRPRNNQMLEQEFLSRAALLHLADRENIPSPSQDAFVRFLAEIPFFQDDEGNFDPNRVTDFLDQAQLSRQFDEATINRTLANDFRIRQLMESIAAPGYTLPFDVEEQARRMEASYDLVLGLLPRETDLGEIEADREELEAFFAERVEAYRIPEQRVVAQVVFEPEDYAETIDGPSEAELEDYFSENRMNYVDEDAEDPAEAIPELSEVRETVSADWRAERSREMALDAAEKFVYALFEDEIAYNAPEIESTAERFDVTLEPLPPVRGAAAPSGTDLPDSAFAEVPRLDSLRYFTDPFEHEGKAYVLILREIIPSRIPDLAEVEEEVLADYREEERQAAFVARGKEIREQLSDAVAEGGSFAEKAESLGLSVTTFEGVGWEDRPDDLPPATLRQAESLPDGEVSSMRVTGEGGHFLYVLGRSAPALGPDTEPYERTRDFLASDNSRRFVSSFVNLLVQSGLSRMEPDARGQAAN